jgi:hypothetical protein
MGIPYSREINAAFEQVTPLVAAGYKVLRTTKNISIILAIIQVLTVIFLGLILLALIALLYTVNPDLEVRSPKLTSQAHFPTPDHTSKNSYAYLHTLRKKDSNSSRHGCATAHASRSSG